MRCTAKLCDGNIPLVANSRVNSYASLRIGYVLHRPANMHDSCVVVAHKLFIGYTPAWQIRWQRIVPEVNWRFYKVIGQHPTADDSRIIVIELSCRDRYTWSNSIEYFCRRQAVSAWI